MQAQLQAQGTELQELRAHSNGTSVKPQLVLGDDISAIITPHLQLAATDTAERKRILAGYPKSRGFLKALQTRMEWRRANTDSEQR